MACFILTDCQDGSVIVTSTDLSANIGQVITIDEQPGHCFVVTPDQNPDCIGIPVTLDTVYPNCDACVTPTTSPCDCPQGTVLVTLPDGTTACQQDVYTLAQGPLPGFACHQDVLGINQTLAGFTPAQWGPSDQYCRYGARFYGETSSLPWPINFTTGCAPATQIFRDFLTNPVPAIGPNVVNTLWGDGTGGFVGPYTGRFNVAGVVPHPYIPCNDGISERKGFVHCMTVATTTTYCFGVGALASQIIINGLVYIDSPALNSDVFQYENWNVFQLTLAPGNYIIQMVGHNTGLDTCGTFNFNNPPFSPRNPGSIPGIAFEIYQSTSAALAAMTTTIQLNAVLVYSTLNELGGKFDYGSVNNYRCPCPLPPAPCYDAFGNYNLTAPILDNCTVNPLNPNANPLIYVCHTYSYTAITPCCYLLTNCDPAGIPYTLTTSTNLSLEVGNVVTISDPAGSPIPGCFIVSTTQCTGSEVPVVVTQSFGPASDGGCALCAPSCYMLEDCSGVIPAYIVTDDLSAYVGQVITLCPPAGTPGECGCFIITLAGGCIGAVPLVGIITNASIDCEACLPDCYRLVNCVDPTEVVITNTNLAAYIGQVIYIDGCPGKCWIVTLSDTCVGAVPVVFLEAFVDCDTCLGIPPEPPLELHPRKVKPGYDTPGCDPAYTEKVYCNYAKAVYDSMLIVRYGVTMCCNDPIQKWEIKKLLLDLMALYDPELCKNTYDTCCPPCAMVSEIVVYEANTCDAPTDMESEIEVPIEDCPAPTRMEGSITIP